MEFLQSSFFVALLVRFWDKLTDLFRGGIFHRISMAIWARTKKGWFYSFAVGGEKADRLWTQSRFYNCLTWLLDLPIRLSRALFSEKTLLGRSYIVSETIEFSENRLSIMTGAFMTALLIIPQSMWNNMYSLLGALALMAMLILAAARYERSLSVREIGAFPVFFAVFTVLSFVTSQQMGLSFRFLIFGITCMMVVLIVTNAPKDEKQLETIVFLCSLGLAACSAYAVLQRIVGVEVDKLCQYSGVVCPADVLHGPVHQGRHPKALVSGRVRTLRSGPYHDLFPGRLAQPCLRSGYGTADPGPQMGTPLRGAGILLHPLPAGQHLEPPAHHVQLR